MSESLRDGIDQLDGDERADRATLKIVEATKLEPDLDAYKVDPANNLLAKFQRDISEGARLTVSLVAKDGRRERFELNESDRRSYCAGDLDQRRAIGNRLILERRLTVALKAARRLTERDLPPVSEHLTPEEEAYLLDFGAIEKPDKLIIRESNGVERYEPAPALLRESWRSAAIGGANARDLALREDFWNDGSDLGGDAYGTLGGRGRAKREYLSRGGPAQQQLLISDVWDGLAKAYYAYTHDPMGKRGCEILADLVVGRGFNVIAKQEAVQTVLDEFVERDRFQKRLHAITIELGRDGELWAWKRPTGDGRLKIRMQPPASIWELVTDAEDLHDVFFYVQRYQTRNVLYADGAPSAANTHYVERTIPADEMIHVKINAGETDARGRSDMFPALGWMRRLRLYMDAVVQKEQAAAAYQWHYKVAGGKGDVQNIASQIPNTDAEPGSAFVTNSQVDIAAVASSVRAPAAQGSTYEALVNHIALAFGFSKDYFGAASHNTRANALVANEPSAKKGEERQDVVHDFTCSVFDAVIDEAIKFGRLPKNIDRSYRVLFPAIIKADSADRIALLQQGEANFYISKRTAAEQFASEMDLDDYDFDDEMAAIKNEMGEDVEPTQLIGKANASVKKGAPAATDIAFDPGEVPNPAIAGGGANAAPPSVTPRDAGALPATAVAAAKKIRDELGRESAIRETSHGALVIVP